MAAWLFSRVASFQFGECPPQPGENAAGFVDLSKAVRRDAEVALGLSAALGCGLTDPGRDQALGLEALQRGVHAADRHIPATVLFEFTRDRHAVSLFAEMD